MSGASPTASVDAVCAGILVADIFVQPLQRLPAAGELIATDDFVIDTGGCAANTATSLVRLGVSAAVVGMVGKDNFGDFIRDDLQRKGVHTAGIVQSEDTGTSKTVILPVIGEDRRFIHTFGANAQLTAAHLDSPLIHSPRFLYIGGYLVLPSLDPDATGALLASARARGAQTVFDVVIPADFQEDGLRSLATILPHVDYFTPNDLEAQILTKQNDPYQQAKAFLHAGCGTAIITMGERGTFVMNEEEDFFVPPMAVNVVDGSGAGDAFAAGLIAGLKADWPLRQSVRLASIVGASACTQLGCTTGVVTREQAEILLQQYSQA